MNLLNQDLNNFDNQPDELLENNNPTDISLSPIMSSYLKECAYDGNELKVCKDYDYELDDDGIADCCEIFGYTIDQDKLVRWSDKLHKDKGFVKYFSDPNNISTTGDPFKDSDKVLGKVDQTIFPDANHPLVAACPEMIVLMERIILSKNQTVTNEHSGSTTEETSRTISSGTTNNHTHGENIGVGFEAEVSATGGASVSMNIGAEWNNAITIDDSDSQSKNTVKNASWSETLNIDKSKTAFLNANIRYWNVGTAPIYEFEPTLSFIVGEGQEGQTIATITAKKNAMANSVLPNAYYPIIGQNPLAFYTNDDFSWQSIILNFDQVEKLQKGEKLLMQTTQITGKYVSINADGEAVIENATSWDKIMTNIYGKTACITIFLKNNIIIRRRVAAKKAVDATQQAIPELTIEEAINIAFSQIKLNVNDLSIRFENEAVLTINHVLFSPVDTEKVQKILDKQLLKNFFNQKIVQGMNISIIQDNEKSTKKKLLKKYQPVIDFMANDSNRKLKIEVDDYYRPFCDVFDMALDKLNELKSISSIEYQFSSSNILIPDKYLELCNYVISGYWEFFGSAEHYQFEIDFIWQFNEMSEQRTIKWQFIFSYEDMTLIKEFSHQFKSHFMLAFLDKYKVQGIVSELRKNPLDKKLRRKLIENLNSNLLSNNIDKIIAWDWSKIPFLKRIYN